LSAETLREEPDAEGRVEVARRIADAIDPERRGALEAAALRDRSTARRDEHLVAAFAGATGLVDLAALSAEAAHAGQAGHALGVAVAGGTLGAISVAFAPEHAAGRTAFADLVVGAAGGPTVGDAEPDLADRAFAPAIGLAPTLAAGVDRPGQGSEAFGAGAVQALARLAVAVDVALGAALADARLVDETARRAAGTFVVVATTRRRRRVVPTTRGEGEREE
jgi:hypothetical protein